MIVPDRSTRPIITIGSRPSLLTVNGMRFLIMDAPSQSNLNLYIKEMKKHGVTHIVRVCEPTYTTTELNHAGICHHNMEYPDGQPPPQTLIEQWLKLVQNTFYDGRHKATTTTKSSSPTTTTTTTTQSCNQYTKNLPPHHILS
mmetsp:Transcript_14978/g.21650  ORF Transcript_14978/g.21650 Transcript_14978/m.21650 type:complete len:143 (-) Transcript_14978:1184-1612(-)